MLAKDVDKLLDTCGCQRLPKGSSRAHKLLYILVHSSYTLCLVVFAAECHTVIAAIKNDSLLWLSLAWQSRGLVLHQCTSQMYVVASDALICLVPRGDVMVLTVCRPSQLMGTLFGLLQL